MANMTGVKKGQFAFDPFVGTGSILVALSHFRCRCVGADIDPRVLRGMMYAGKADKNTDDTKRDIFENFRVYGLEAPELIRMDNHVLDRHIKLKRVGINSSSSSSSNGNSSSSSGSGNSGNSSCSDSVGMFDVIVTDPPYGIRAGAKKSGKKNPVTYTVSEERRHDHVPSTQHYPVEEVMLDLLHNAARTLVLGGKLNYLIPTILGFREDDLPQHPCLRFITMCEQQLSTRHGRHAVVMEKYREYTEELEAEFCVYKAKVVAGEDAGFGTLMSRLEAALAVDAYANEQVVKRPSAKSLQRKESKIRRAQVRAEGTYLNKNNA